MRKNGKDNLVSLILAAVLTVAVIASAFVFSSFAKVEPASSSTLGFSDKLRSRMDSITIAAAGDLVDFRRSYYIPPGTVVCPKPHQECYGSSVNDGDILAVISDSDLARSVDMVWHSGISYHNDTAPAWYSDPSIFAIAWKESNGQSIMDFAEIIIADGSQFRRFLCGNTFGSNTQKYATTMAESVNAVFAMNGDFYSNRQAGIVIYQGKVYRNNPQFLDNCLIDANGDMLFPDSKSLGNTEELQKYVDENEIQFSLSFGPILVEDGVAITKMKHYDLGEVDELFARSAIGQVGERHYLYCVVEGAKGGYTGTTVLNMASIMANHKCEKAYTIDGGQTAELIVNNKLYSRVVHEEERQVSDIIYFATADD